MSRNWTGAARNQPTIQTRRDDEEQGRKDALGALGVEHREREMADGAFGQDDARDQKARDHEEHVDPGEAAGQQRAIGVEGDHPDDRERAQPVDVRSEIEIAPASRRGEVGRVEGLIQRGFP